MSKRILKMIAALCAAVAVTLAGIPAAQAAPGNGVSITPFGGKGCC